MRRLTESQLRKVIREELVGLLNEISPFERGPIFGSPRRPTIEDTEVDVSEAGSEIRGKQKLMAVTGAQVINLFPKFREMIKNKQASLIPLPLKDFLIDYEVDLDDYNNKIKIAKNDEAKQLAEERLDRYIFEMNKKEVIVFYYNHAERYDRGYTIEVFPLSIKRAQRGEQFSSEAHEMRQVSDPTLDRSEIEEYEKVLGIKVPKPTNPQNVTFTQTTRSERPPMSAASEDEGLTSFRRQLGGVNHPTLRTPPDLRENKKRNR
jgi:hypothetical protein